MPFGLSSGGPTSRKLPVILVAVVGVLRVYFLLSFEVRTLNDLL